MAKKNLKSGIEGLFQPSVPELKNADNEKSKFVKATYYYDLDQLSKIKAIAYYERKPIGKVIDKALNQYLESYVDLKKAIKIAP